MKKIINGKKYDTSTAELIGSYSNDLSYSDFSYYCEELYKKRTGEFFLYGKGGAMTEYARSCGQNSWCGGEEIIPFSEKEAKRWAEEYLSYDCYVKAFGEVEE